METKTLIEKLSGDLKKPGEAHHWFSKYWLSWAGCFALMAVFTYVAALMFPADIHLPENLGNRIFWLESSMWFGMALLAAIIAYRSSLPGKLNPLYVRVAYSLALILSVSLLARWSPAVRADEFLNEMHINQGPCGFFIGITGFFGALWMFQVLRQAAPLRLGFTAAWSAVSVGALGSMFMHLVCTHESSAHVFLWHMLPLVVLTGIASSLSQKLLRW